MGRLSAANISEYIIENYSETKYTKMNFIIGYPNLLQEDYGGKNDCTITSITALCCYEKLFPNLSIEQVYEKVNDLCKKLKMNNGVIPFLNKYLIKNVTKLKSSQKYLKNIGFNWNTIKTQIDKSNPILLSLYNDGRDYYKNHTVSVVGYIEYEKAKMLVVYDNWFKSFSYIDYNKLSNICCINYLL